MVRGVAGHEVLRREDRRVLAKYAEVRGQRLGRTERPAAAALELTGACARLAKTTKPPGLT